MALKTAEDAIKIAKKYLGCKQGDKRHKDLVKTFNSVQPHGNVATYTCAWCAITWTAIMIKSGHTMKTAPMGYNCGTLIEDAKRLGLWEERDDVKPKVGWGIIYNWSDNGVGDCRTGASHVGIVSKVSGSTITLIEGNKGTTKACGERVINVNGRYIRGYIKQTYKKPITKKKVGYLDIYPLRSFPRLKQHSDGLYLAFGDTGANVTRLNRFLAWYLKIERINPKGQGNQFTKETEKAVKKWQKNQGFRQTGKFGETSLEKAKKYKRY